MDKKEDNKKSANEQLQEKLFLAKKSCWNKFVDKDRDAVFRFGEGYKRFMDSSKTERRCVENIIAILKKHEFKDMAYASKLKAGDKVFKNIKGKCVIAAIVGKNSEQLQLVGSHVDSPRLDLKPLPIFEESGLALLKTHYYGGVKKYHWVNTPLALHGVVFTKEGKKMTISIGEEGSDPKFIIPDLLPHLAKTQMERKADKVVEGEELNILVGNIPINDDKIKEQVKLSVLKHLHDKFGITEEDFACAELELVPAGHPVDIGFDRALIGTYGQDDKVCVYSSLMALVEVNAPAHTAVGFFVDKEEIGSTGDTGAASFVLKNFCCDFLKLTGKDISTSSLLEKSNAISADVTAGVDPNFKDVNDPLNASVLGRGVSVEKYGGGGGKYSTNDASAEYMQFMRGILDKNKIPWQTGELGKIDLGGGGTIGMYLSRYGMNCVDAGPCVLGMHSTCEVASKVDIYCGYLLYKAFFKE
ncbi:aminopeptidase [Candidatus Woesearchaeota archaeon]|nr:aminopeptidase [Candidatus Woesearchaeota archaeon]